MSDWTSYGECLAEIAWNRDGLRTWEARFETARKAMLDAWVELVNETGAAALPQLLTTLHAMTVPCFTHDEIIAALKEQQMKIAELTSPHPVP